MRTVPVFTNGNNQTVRIPKDMAFANIKELEIFRAGDSLILHPPRPDWLSFAELEKADVDFLLERQDVISNNVREFERVPSLIVEDWSC